MKDNLTNDFNVERNLKQAFARLAESEAPSRDLWPEIENKLKLHVTKAYTPKWIPWAFAATLLISFSCVFLSWNNLQNANELIAKNQLVIESGVNNDIQSQIKLMTQEYSLAKSTLLIQIGNNGARSDSDLMSEVKSNLIIIEQATDELKAAILKQPNNPSLPSLLKTTYQQELVVLSQLAKINLES